MLLGGVGAVFSAFALVGLLIFWSQYMQYANCLNGARTTATQNACQQQFKNSIGHRITHPRQRRDRARYLVDSCSSAHGLTWMRWPPASSVSSTMSAGRGALTRAGTGPPCSAPSAAAGRRS